MSRVVRVLYHCPCPDGAYAALAAYLHFQKQTSIKDVKFVPHAVYKKIEVQNNPLFASEAEVFLLDYCGPENFLVDLSRQVKRVTLLDHHKTAVEFIDKWKKENLLGENVEIKFIMEQSGATIAWDYFSKEAELFPDAEVKSKALKFYQYIEDNDLWRNALPSHKEFSSGLRGRNLEFDCDKNPKIFEELQYFDVDSIIQEGKEILEKEQNIITKEVAESFEIILGGDSSLNFGKCLAVASEHPDLRSSMGNTLAKKSQAAGLRAIGCIVYQEPDMEDKTKYKVSLRSLGDEDTTPISLKFGGGGHKNASSCLLSMEVFHNKWRADVSDDEDDDAQKIKKRKREEQKNIA